MFKIMAFFIITLFARLFVKVDILLTCEKYLYDNIISLRGKIWDHKTSLIQPHFIEVSVPRQEWERSCICILRVLILSLSTILILDFRIVPTVWHFLFFHSMNKTINNISSQTIDNNISSQTIEHKKEYCNIWRLEIKVLCWDMPKYMTVCIVCWLFIKKILSSETTRSFVLKVCIIWIT
jgi:hypothetical protein